MVYGHPTSKISIHTHVTFRPHPSLNPWTSVWISIARNLSEISGRSPIAAAVLWYIVQSHFFNNDCWMVYSTGSYEVVVISSFSQLEETLVDVSSRTNNEWRSDLHRTVEQIYRSDRKKNILKCVSSTVFWSIRIEEGVTLAGGCIEKLT